MNKYKFLENVKAAIRGEKKNTPGFNMSYWSKYLYLVNEKEVKFKTNPRRFKNCGTACCLAGHIVGQDIGYNKEPDNRYETYSQRAIKIWEKYFGNKVTPQLWGIFLRTVMTAEQACAELDRLAKESE